MAKTKFQAGLKELPADPAGAGEEGPGIDWQPNDAVAVTDLPSWDVSLNCPTPLAFKTLRVQAATEQEAWEKFMAANGICGSQHDRTITRVG